jgi:hypothetical protein
MLLIVCQARGREAEGVAGMEHAQGRARAWRDGDAGDVVLRRRPFLAQLAACRLQLHDPLCRRRVQQGGGGRGGERHYGSGVAARRAPAKLARGGVPTADAAVARANDDHIARASGGSFPLARARLEVEVRMLGGNATRVLGRALRLQAEVSPR